MHYLKYSQKLPLTLEESWTFFSSPENLKILTPDFMGFEITNDLENKKTYPGQVICYIIKPLWNIPLSWVTEITHADEPHYFIDQQRFGPYKYWRHEHRFLPIPEGVEMIDTIYYKMPFGPLGQIIHSLKVKQDIENIFSYRRSKLEKLFGVYPKKV